MRFQSQVILNECNEVKNPVEFPDDAQFLSEYLLRTHGILRFRAAPPSPPRRSTQDDSRFEVHSAQKSRRVFGPSV